MTIAVADSWEGRSTTATLAVTIPADTVEIGDLLVVFTFCAGSGSGEGLVTDDAANSYTSFVSTPATGTFTYTVDAAYALVQGVPSQVNVVNSAGGANDVAGVVLRVTHDGTGWLDVGSAIADTVTIDDPTTTTTSVSSSDADSFAGPGSALFLAALTHDGVTTTMAPAGTWTEVEEEEDAASGVPYSVVSKVVVEQPGNTTHQWTTGASRDYADVIFGFTENIADLQGYTVSVAPTPAITGLTLETASAGSLPDPADFTYHILVGPPDQIPDSFNSELVRAISRSGNELTIERAQGGTRAHAIDVGWTIWFDHLYQTQNINELIVEAASSRLRYEVLPTIPWP